MEFEYSGIIYIDVDHLFEECRERNCIDANKIRDTVNDYVLGLDDVDYYHIEGWMIDEVVTEIKKRIDKCLGL